MANVRSNSINDLYLQKDSDLSSFGASLIINFLELSCNMKWQYEWYLKSPAST